MRRKSQQGQQVIEYLILVVVVVLVLIIFLKPKGPFGRMVDQVLRGTLGQINYEADQIR